MRYRAGVEHGPLLRHELAGRHSRGIGVRESDLRVSADDHALSIPSVDGAAERIHGYVRPLAVALDGVTNYGDVERMVSSSEAIAGGRTGVDADLLCWRSSRVRRSGSRGWATGAAPSSSSAPWACPQDRSAALPGACPVRDRSGLRRGDDRPRRRKARRDRRLRDRAWSRRRLPRAARRPRDGRRDRGLGRAELRTEYGRALAAARRALMREFAPRLRAEHAEFGRG